MEHCTIDEITGKLRIAFDTSADQIASEIGIIQEYALREYSRAHFSDAMHQFLRQALEARQGEFS
ncbi:MAG: hypothetical protein IPK19_05760 [Chloroflexi bacterium]|nr:hypothetical protein [Chloroflexota bacterium]